jgi:hypothetical protein
MKRMVTTKAIQDHRYVWRGRRAPALEQFSRNQTNPQDADPVGDCVVFDIKNNEASLISYISYEMGTVTVLAVLTHKEYDKGGWKSACNC